MKNHQQKGHARCNSSSDLNGNWPCASRAFYRHRQSPPALATMTKLSPRNCMRVSRLAMRWLRLRMMPAADGSVKGNFKQGRLWQVDIALVASTNPSCALGFRGKMLPLSQIES